MLFNRIQNDAHWWQMAGLLSTLALKVKTKFVRRSAFQIFRSNYSNADDNS